jgi:hypothetical protein
MYPRRDFLRASGTIAIGSLILPDFVKANKHKKNK